MIFFYFYMEIKHEFYFLGTKPNHVLKNRNTYIFLRGEVIVVLKTYLKKRKLRRFLENTKILKY